ncbi:hypothetical protein MYRNA_13 [Mycobacterium phage Myrna]|uniref:Uncharacterized protein n=1 Tax=Mycobacterium phage Myrna TaxID=546805 RepID=B5LJ24_9CAUD|nr:gp13 [Mycobacterium phage Myrna]ACH62021.1 hypothetical protein MYRNA_13 [Mycobacterium phage Myrna]
MARDTDRKKISEAVRTQSLWRRETYGDLLTLTNGHSSGSYVELVTANDEALYVEYTPSGRIRRATYRHWDSGRPGYPIVCTKHIRRNKLRVVEDLVRTGTFTMEERHYL